ncbi:hypothetical protein FPV67DRAFT_181752 [Lyophyllum atratum]|nr:hypothetical protein FPV67DRAFT_181752 [Lyophyllum atratum]
MLKTCALVCRDWLHISRPHLFQRIHNYVLEHLEHVDHLAILRDPNCTIPPHVRTIAVNGNIDRGNSDEWDYHQYICHERRMDDLWSNIVPRCSSLRAIELTSMDPSELDRLRLSLDSARQQITDVHVDDTLFKSMHDFMVFVSDFPSLETLSISTSHRFIPDSFPTSHLPQPPPRLRKLCIENGSGVVPFDTFVLEWLLGVGYANVQAMELCMWSKHPTAIDALMRYITFLGPSLVDLELHGWGGDYAEAMAVPISANTGLCHVDLLCNRGFEIYEVSGKFLSVPTSWIPTISILPRSVESIILDMVTSASQSGPEELSEFDWKPVDELLSGGQFPLLRELIIWADDLSFRRHFDIDGHFHRLWTRLLPRCASKLILIVKVSPREERPFNTCR